MILVFQNGVSETAKQWLNETLEERISWLLEEKQQGASSFSSSSAKSRLLVDQERDVADNGESIEVKVSWNQTEAGEPKIRVSFQ